MKVKSLVVVAAICLVAGVARGVVTVTPEAKWSYSGDTPGVFTEAFTNAVASGSSVGVVYDVATDATISGNMTSDHGGFVKLGPGTLTLAGANNLSMALGNSYSFSDPFSRFALDETGNHAIKGFSEFNILDGKLVVTNKTTTTKQTASYAIMGGFTAAVGEIENDVTIEICKGGKIQQNVMSSLGFRHGFVNNTAPGKPALALLRIYPGGNYSQGGGKGFYFGGSKDSPDTATWGAFNSDIRLEVLGGTFTAGNSYAGFFVAQYNGQRSTIIVKDGGIFQDYYVRTGLYSIEGSVAPLEIDVSGVGSEFRVQYFENNANAKSGPTTTLRVRDGATFRCDQMTTKSNSIIDIFLDDATVSTYAILNTHVATDRKVVFPAGVTSLTLGAGGATLISTGTATNPTSNKVQLPITAVFAKGFAPSPDLPAGTPDGGLVIKGGTPTNVVELAGVSTYAGLTLLQSGTLTLSGDGALPAASAFTQVGGTLFANTKDITRGDATFGIGATIKLAAGRRLIVNGDLALSIGTMLAFLDANGDEIAAPFDSKPFITVPAAHAAALENMVLPNRTISGLRLSSKSVTLDPGGDTATLYVSFAAAAADSADVWSGGGAANTLATQADNWKSGSAPSLVNGSLLATFAEGGDTATFAGVADLRGIAFEGTSFNLEGAGNSSLLLGSGGFSFAAPEGGATPTYTIGLPFASRASQNVAVPSGVNLAFTDSVEMSAPVTVSGAGGVGFSGETSTFGNVKVESGTSLSLSGHIRNVDGLVYGVPPSETDATALRFYGAPDSINRNVLSNVVVEKSAYIKDGKMGERAFLVPAGSTCTFKGGVYVTAPWKYIDLGSGAECVFENGATLVWTLKFNGTGRCIVRNKPITCGSNFTLDKATLRMECSGSSCSIAMFVEDAGRLELAAPNAFTKTALNLANEASTVDLCGTSQQFKYVLCSGAKPTVTGAPGSVLEVTQGAPANASVIGITNINCKIEGSVGISMTGVGLLRLKSQQFASAGDVSVSNGTLEFAADASWLNGTNVTVSGTGTLRIGNAETFNREFAVIRFADDGKIAVPSGMTQTFAEGWDGDKRLTPGALYTSANLPAHVAPGGSIHIAGGGMMLIFR